MNRQRLLKPFRIGEIEIAFPVVLAALAGYSDLAYRRICRRLGAPYAATEMMLDRMLLVLRHGSSARMARTEEADHPVAGQIVGNDPGRHGRGRRRCCDEMGFDVIDLNFACPVRKALGRRRGGYLMSQPEQAVEIVRAVVRGGGAARHAQGPPASSPTPTTRTRSGGSPRRPSTPGPRRSASTPAASSRSTPGPADWEFLARVKAAFPRPDDHRLGRRADAGPALDMLRQTGVDAATAARGCLGNPWFFRQVRDLAEGREPYMPSLAEQRAVMLDHLDGAVELYGRLGGPKQLRKFGIKYARLHPSPKKVRMAFVAVRRPEDWHEVLRVHYGDEQDGAE